MNIYQRLNEVRKVVDYAKKEKEVKGSGYLAVTHDQITALTRDHFVAQGIIIVPSMVSSKVADTGTTTAKGTPFIRYEATYEFSVVNADEPTDRFSGTIEAHAIDQGDKAPGKALSYAKKAFILKLLEIESGVDDEAREEQKPQKESKITPNAGAGDELTAKEKQRVADVAIVVKDCLAEGKDWDAYSNVELANFDTEEKLYLWAQFNSKERSALKRMAAAERSKEGTQQ
jgi:hypothetical protein